MGVVGASPPPSGIERETERHAAGLQRFSEPRIVVDQIFAKRRRAASPVACGEPARQRRGRLRFGSCEQDIDADRGGARRARRLDQPRDAFAPPAASGPSRASEGAVDVEDDDAAFRRGQARRGRAGGHRRAPAANSTIPPDRARLAAIATATASAPQSAAMRLGLGAHVRLRRTAPARRDRRTADRWCAAARPPARAGRARH